VLELLLLLVLAVDAVLAVETSLTVLELLLVSVLAVLWLLAVEAVLVELVLLLVWLLAEEAVLRVEAVEVLLLVSVLELELVPAVQIGSLTDPILPGLMKLLYSVNNQLALSVAFRRRISSNVARGGVTAEFAPKVTLANALTVPVCPVPPA